MDFFCFGEWIIIIWEYLLLFFPRSLKGILKLFCKLMKKFYHQKREKLGLILAQLTFNLQNHQIWGWLRYDSAYGYLQFLAFDLIFALPSSPETQMRKETEQVKECLLLTNEKTRENNYRENFSISWFWVNDWLYCILWVFSQNDSDRRSEIWD